MKQLRRIDIPHKGAIKEWRDGAVALKGTKASSVMNGTLLRKAPIGPNGDAARADRPTLLTPQLREFIRAAVVPSLVVKYRRSILK